MFTHIIIRLLNNMKTNKKKLLFSLKITRESFNHSKSEQRNHIHPLQGVLLSDSAMFTLCIIYYIRVTAKCILHNTLQCCHQCFSNYIPRKSTVTVQYTNSDITLYQHINKLYSAKRYLGRL